MMLQAWLVCALCFSASNISAQEQLESVRMWHAPDRTRVVFDVSDQVVYRYFSLDNPSRVVVDLHDTRRGSALKQAQLNALTDTAASPIKKLRSGVRKGDDLRIVLDLKQDLKPDVFLLPPNEQYGHRLVVDLRTEGAQKTKSSKVIQANQVSNRSAQSSAPVSVSKPPPQAIKKVQKAKPLRDLIIAIDAGHGGEDPGAIGKHGTYEKHVVMAIARALQKKLSSEPGITAILVREGDYFVPLNKRRHIAREKHQADLFLSIHADAFTQRSVRGASVFILSRNGASSAMAEHLAAKENQSDMIGGVVVDSHEKQLKQVMVDLAMDGSMAHSAIVGRYILNELGTVARLHKKHVERAGFRVLKTPDIPSVLIETGFISNPEEERKLKLKTYQRSLANAITRGVKQYFDKHPVPDTYYANQDQIPKTLAKKTKNVDAYKRHRIRYGETLSGIAQKYRVKLAQLRRVNGLSSDKIIVGQVLQIPLS